MPAWGPNVDTGGAVRVSGHSGTRPTAPLLVGAVLSEGLPSSWGEAEPSTSFVATSSASLSAPHPKLPKILHAAGFSSLGPDPR